MGYFNVIRSGEQASKAVRLRSVFLYGYGDVSLVAKPRVVIPLS